MPDRRQPRWRGMGADADASARTRRPRSRRRTEPAQRVAAAAVADEGQLPDHVQAGFGNTTARRCDSGQRRLASATPVRVRLSPIEGRRGGRRRCRRRPNSPAPSTSATPGGTPGKARRVGTGGGTPPKAVTGRAGRGQRLPSGALPASVVGPIHTAFASNSRWQSRTSARFGVPSPVVSRCYTSSSVLGPFTILRVVCWILLLYFQ